MNFHYEWRVTKPHTLIIVKAELKKKQIKSPFKSKMNQINFENKRFVVTLVSPTLMHRHRQFLSIEQGIDFAQTKTFERTSI
jgi:hypothetical protein